MPKKSSSRKHKTVDAWPKKELFLFEPKTLFVIIVTSVLTLAIVFFGEQGSKFFTSVLSPVPAHEPFDGTVYPVQKVPNWVKLTEAERKMKYSELPASKLITIPSYNPTRLAIPMEKLKWGDPVDDQIRNEKITYSVPYLGSYRLNGMENDGSHPAVDIKIPEGTPIYAIANGTVTKTDTTGTGGFGKHIVVQHNNFPSLEDKNKLSTIHSSYSHLSSVIIKPNDVVKKGQLIGYSGQTGTATTPHLHFQIDSDDVAWHPYWPFNSADMKSAGYSFFEAINQGLGRGNAVAQTINPVKFVQQYYGAQNVVIASTNQNSVNNSVSSDLYQNTKFVINVTSANIQLKEGDSIRFTIQAFDSNGILLTKPTFTDEISLSLINGIGKLNRTSINASTMRTGITTLVKATELVSGTDKLVLRFRGNEFTSPEFSVGNVSVPQDTTKPDSPIAGFIINTDKQSVAVGGTIQIQIQAADENASPVTSNFVLKNDASIYMQGRVGSLSKSTLRKEDFVNGIATVTFTASYAGETTPTIQYNNQFFYGQNIRINESTASADTLLVPVLSAGLSETSSEEIVPVTPDSEELPSETILPEEIQIPFNDISKDSKYLTALNVLKEKKLVAGYSDGSFKPEKIVTRAETIALILKSIGHTEILKFSKIFPDVTEHAWYGPFVTTAHELEFVKGYPDGTFKPESEVNLAEFFVMLYVAGKADIDPQIVINLPEGVALNEWYTVYLQEAIRKNILLVGPGEIISPERPLTRGDIALFLYRLVQNQDL